MHKTLDTLNDVILNSLVVAQMGRNTLDMY